MRDLQDFTPWRRNRVRKILGFETIGYNMDSGRRFGIGLPQIVGNTFGCNHYRIGQMECSFFEPSFELPPIRGLEQ